MATVRSLVRIPLLLIFYATFFGSFFIGSLGFIAGLWATKFDHTATVTNFIIQPLSFLSGVFYTIDRLPLFFQKVSAVNPFFHIINIFRYGFLGVSDGPLLFGIIYLPNISSHYLLNGHLLLWLPYMNNWLLTYREFQARQIHKYHILILFH